MKLQLTFKPIPPIENPETEQFCKDMANKFVLAGLKPGGSPAPQWYEEFNNWISVRRLVRWEVLAIKTRVLYLIQESGQ